MQYGPKIVTSGLVLCLDAAEVNSYAGEPTTNLISNGDFENNTTSGWSFDPKTNGSFSVTSDDKKSGLYSAKLTNSTSSDIALWKSISITSGQQYTMSAWIKNISCPTTPYFSISSGGSFNDTSSGSSTTGVTAGSDWVYVSKTFTATNTQTTNPYIRTNSNASQGYFLVDDFQIENKTYSTPFINGSRSATNGWLDLSGNGNNGTLTNMVGTGVSHYRDGQVIKPINNAYLDFDGSNDYVSTSFGSGRDPYSNPISFVAWVKSDTTTNNKMWLDHGSNGTNQRLYSALITADNTAAFGIQGSAWSLPSNADTSKWYHQAIVMDSGTARAYYDGIAAGTKSYTSYTLPGNTIVGGRSTYYWDGKIACFAIYDKALTAAEVLSNYNATKGRFS